MRNYNYNLDLKDHIWMLKLKEKYNEVLSFYIVIFINSCENRNEKLILTKLEEYILLDIYGS